MQVGGTKETQEELAEVTRQQVAETGLGPEPVGCTCQARRPRPRGLGPSTQASAIWLLLASGGELPGAQGRPAPSPTIQRSLSFAETAKAGDG